MPIDTWIKVWRIGFAISIFGVVQFLICCMISMSMYPGGTILDKQTIDYSLSENYLSDLGRSVSLSGQDNEVGANFFNWSIAFMGFSMMPFFFFLPTQASDQIGAMIACSVLGMISAVAMGMLGMFPVDLYPLLHMSALLVWLALLFFITSIHALVMLGSKQNPMLLSLVSVAVAMLTVSYMYHGTETAAAVIFGREIPTQAVLLQKLVVIAGLIWCLTFSIKMLVSADFSEFYERDLSKETDEYLSQLGINPRQTLD